MDKKEQQWKVQAWKAPVMCTWYKDEEWRIDWETFFLQKKETFFKDAWKPAPYYERQPAGRALPFRVLAGEVEDTRVVGLRETWLAEAKLGGDHPDVHIRGAAEVWVAWHVVHVAV